LLITLLMFDVLHLKYKKIFSTIPNLKQILSFKLNRIINIFNNLSVFGFYKLYNISTKHYIANIIILYSKYYIAQ